MTSSARPTSTSTCGWYCRRLRLERGHRALQAVDPLAGDTVAAIGVRWGFADPKCFATDYRATCGHPPSHTLCT